METVKEVQAEAINVRDMLFKDLCDEMGDMGLLAVAKSVAHAFIQSGELHQYKPTLEEAIERGMAGEEPITQERVIRKFFQLCDLGYIWQDQLPEFFSYEPGIPSLMTYVYRNS